MADSTASSSGNLVSIMTCVSGRSPRISRHASTPDPSGSRTSITTRSGANLARRLDGLGNRAGLGNDVQIRPSVEDGDEALPNDLVVVDHEQPKGTAGGLVTGLMVAHHVKRVGSPRTTPRTIRQPQTHCARLSVPERRPACHPSMPPHEPPCCRCPGGTPAVAGRGRSRSRRRHQPRCTLDLLGQGLTRPHCRAPECRAALLRASRTSCRSSASGPGQRFRAPRSRSTSISTILLYRAPA